MNAMKIAPNELRKMLTVGWMPVGFQQTIAAKDSDGTDGYAILLKNDYDLAIVTPTVNTRTGTLEMTIVNLTSSAR